ncbi:hypothetical protein, partial [Chryseobacterium sp. CCH4-E10]|uniref:hypothetical protein n=1 Tax=Chryseobacterium sp. CCH4-E10 TaxID=1768758 RepID=UPI000ADD7E39
TILDCGNEYFRYYNYTNKVNSNEIKHIPNLELIDNKSLTFYLENGVDFKDIKQEQLISLQRSVFF